MGASAFEPERTLVRGVDQDPVSFDVAVARWLPRPNQCMFSVFGLKRGTLGQELDDFPQLVEILPPFPHALDIAGELFGLRDPLHFSQLSNIASNESNS